MLSGLGEVLVLSHVRIIDQLSASSTQSDSEAGSASNSSAERHERLLMLFDTGVLVTLSVSPRVSGYCYQVRGFLTVLDRGCRVYCAQAGM